MRRTSTHPVGSVRRSAPDGCHSAIVWNGDQMATRQPLRLLARIADRLNDDLNGHADATVVNLASNEYFKAVDREALRGQVIGAKFLNVKDGESRSLMYYAKHARGSMARWIMENRVDRADGLRDFNDGGYSLDASASTETELVFTRPQLAQKEQVNCPVRLERSRLTKSVPPTSLQQT